MLDKQFGGLEFLCSIPGVVGGSVKTNAGCFGCSVGDVIVEAEIIDGVGEIKPYPSAICSSPTAAVFSRRLDNSQHHVPNFSRQR